MAQYRIDTNEMLSNNKTIYEVVQVGTGPQGNVVSQANPFPVTAAGAGSSAFGETLSAEHTCVVQLDALYGIGGEQADQFQTYTANGGVATTENNMFKVSSSANTYSYGVVRSKRFLRYRPGQGAVGRFAAKFDTPTALTTQRAGLFNQEDALMVGYDGTDFGVLYAHDGLAHIHQFLITAGPSASTNATITLNGTAFTVPLVSGETVYQTAARISRFDFGSAWIAEQRDDRVVFLSTATNPLAGAFSFSHATATATLTVRQSGVAVTEEWIAQADWNGPGKSVVWDPSKFNVYQIQYRWLGAGVIRFSAEHPDTGEIVLLHSIHHVNRNTTLHLGNPSMKIGYVSYNLGGGAKTVYGGSMMMAVEGTITRNDFPRAAHADKTGLAKDLNHHLLTVENPTTREGKINTKELILQDLVVSSQCSDPAKISLYLNEELLTGVHDLRTRPKTIAMVSLATGTFANTATSITPVIAYTLGINGTLQFDLTPYRLIVPAGGKVSVAISASQSISRAICALTWLAD